MQRRLTCTTTVAASSSPIRKHIGLKQLHCELNLPFQPLSYTYKCWIWCPTKTDRSFRKLRTHGYRRTEALHAPPAGYLHRHRRALCGTGHLKVLGEARQQQRPRSKQCPLRTGQTWQGQGHTGTSLRAMTAKQETKLQTKHGFTPIPGVSARALRTLASSPEAVCACRPRMRVNKGELNGQSSPTQMIWKRLPGQHPYNASLFGILFGA